MTDVASLAATLVREARERERNLIGAPQPKMGPYGAAWARARISPRQKTRDHGIITRLCDALEEREAELEGEVERLREVLDEIVMIASSPLHLPPDVFP